MTRPRFAYWALIAFLAACAGGSPAPNNPAATNGSWSRAASLIPPEFRPLGHVPFHGIPAPRNRKTRGIYVSEFDATSILGYPPNNSGNGPPTCSVTAGSYVNDFLVDSHGYLVVPSGGDRAIYFFGKGMCAAELGAVDDPYGQPADAAIARGSAPDKDVVIGHIYDNSVPGGSISLCSLTTGCKRDVWNSALAELAGVATKDGNCWGSGVDGSGTAVLLYFKHCRKPGKVASGFVNAYYGGLDFDRDGNLVSISYLDAKLYVYKGCDPVCTLVGGPFTLNGETVFGHLNERSTEFVGGDFQYGEADVYKYAPTRLTYEYSFDNGLNASEIVEGVGFNPE